MLDSGKIHSFVHPRVVKLMSVKPLQGAVLAAIVTNGNQMLCCDVIELDLTFSAEGGDCQEVPHSQLYVLEDL